MPEPKKEKIKPLTKVFRLEIVKPVEMEWKEAGDKLRELQRWSAVVLNWCIRQYYAEASKNVDDKDFKTLKKSDLGNVGKSLCKIINQKFGEHFSVYVYNQLHNIARKKFKSDWYEIFVRGSKSLPSYKASNCPIYLDYAKGQGYKIGENKTEKGIEHYIKMKIFPEREGRFYKEATFILHSKAFQDNNKKVIWDRIASGQYKPGMVQILWKERLRKWFVNISYSFTPEKTEGLNPNIRVGVDIGMNVPVYLALNEGWAREGIQGDDIIKVRTQIERRRRNLRRNERKIYDRRTGHGRKHKIEPIEKLRELENNFRRTANHRLSKAVVNFAIQNNAGVIVMEDLKGGYTPEDPFLKNWTFFELQTMIEQKAAEKVIQIEKIKPAKTSQRCSKCGYIDAKNRYDKNDKTKFKCLKCGEEFHADYNAARNIATPKIVEIIQKTLEDQKKDFSETTKENENNKGSLTLSFDN